MSMLLLIVNSPFFLEIGGSIIAALYQHTLWVMVIKITNNARVRSINRTPLGPPALAPLLAQRSGSPTPLSLCISRAWSITLVVLQGTLLKVVS